MVCSACRKDIPFRGKHWVCSVSTCNRARTRLSNLLSINTSDDFGPDATTRTVLAGNERS